MHSVESVRRARLGAVVSAFLAVVLGTSRVAAVDVWTHQNDNSRTGANTSENILNTSNVNKTTFGKLFYYPVDGQVFAEPLYVSNLAIAGGTHNVVYIATMHNTVYAVDADNAATASTPLWSVHLEPSIPLPDAKIGNNLPEGGGFCGTNYGDLHVEVGILSTPVIDLASKTLYTVTKTKDASGNYFDHLHALDIVTGAEKMGGPVAISASVTGKGSVPVKTFLPYRGNQRSGLALGNGKVYVTYASYCDAMPYYGWVFGYSASNLPAAPVLWNAALDGDHNGIWMVGGSPSIDAAGNVFVITGNGPVNTDVGGGNYGDSFVKLSPNLSVVDFFTPFNAASLAGDGDVNLGSPLLVPGTNVVLGAGKEAKVYLVDQTNMGHFHSGSDSQILQSFSIGTGWPNGGFVYWQSPSGAQVYVASDQVRAFKFSGNTLVTTAASTGTWGGGGLLSLSANGSTAGSGILWNLNGSTLHAANAENLAQELWNTGQNSARDAIGGSTKFAVPMIANGKVYVPSMGNVVPVYGILGSGPTPTPGPTTATATATPSPTPLPPSTIAITTNHVFVPSTMSLLVGMTASWINQDGLTHTATSTTGVWDSGQILPGATYSRTFTTAGSFPYYCTLHPNMTGQINVTSSPTILLAVNSGGPAASPFVADVDFAGGGTINHANAINLSGVVAPAPAAVYQTARTGNFTYTLPGFAAGSNHLVRLHFCETFFAAAGQRTFNVILNGTQVLTNYDVFAKAGAQNKAVVETFSTSANASGQYVVQFTSVVNNSLVSGIEVSDAPASATPTPTATTSGPTATFTATTAATTTPTPTVTPTPTATAVAGANLALNKPVTASSIENAASTANLAVDGNTTTRWSSAFSDPQWISVDLGAVTAVTRVRLNWEAAYGKAYTIDVSSDNVGWTTIKTQAAGVGGIEDWTGLSGSGRYVRMFGTARGSAYGYSLWELEVYGTGGAATPTATARARATSTPTPTATATATPTSAGATLLSQGHAVVASSVENAGTAAANAVDGNTTTRWSSAFSDPQWIYVDLGATHTLSRVVLTWEAAYATAYRIETSPDAVTWSSVSETPAGDGGTDDLAVTGSGRYVRMYATARATVYGDSLWELQVYGQ
jgi:plastocyanin